MIIAKAEYIDYVLGDLYALSIYVFGD